MAIMQVYNASIVNLVIVHSSSQAERSPGSNKTHKLSETPFTTGKHISQCHEWLSLLALLPFPIVPESCTVPIRDGRRGRGSRKLLRSQFHVAYSRASGRAFGGASFSFSFFAPLGSVGVVAAAAAVPVFHGALIPGPYVSFLLSCVSASGWKSLVVREITLCCR